MFNKPAIFNLEIKVTHERKLENRKAAVLFLVD